MRETNQTAKEIFQTYQSQLDALINTYCQAVRNHPFEKFPELTRAIWRVSRCAEAWYWTALKLAKQKYFQGE